MGSLFVVATPIGNLEDITLRALNVLKEADLVLAEDTRHARILLDRYEIKVPVTSYHQFSGLAKIETVIAELESGKKIALVSDAGTPGISDPGQYLIARILEALPETEIVPIPGASAPVSLLSVSGFNTDSYVFLGFLPKKKGRQTLFKKLAEEERTIVFFESPNRIRRTLSDLAQYLGSERKTVLGRELTKKFEEISRGTLAELAETAKEKGEFVVAIEGKK